MAIEKVRIYLHLYQLDGKIREFAVSSATVELAAAALGCEPARIAKSLCFLVAERCVLVVAAGDARIDNQKYRQFFNTKPRMLPAEMVLDRVGHEVGGVCPFAINPGVTVYLDESLYRFTSVFPACGSANSAIELTLAELESLSRFSQRIDVCRAWQ